MKPLRILSLGAGVQSTTILMMMIEGELERPDHVIFADTQWEPNEVYEHLEQLEYLMHEQRIPFHKVTAGNIREDALNPNKRFVSMPLHTFNQDGTKGMVRRQCTNEYKIKPLLQKQRELVGLPKGGRSKEHLATTIIGISYDESQRMRDPAFPWLINEYPLVDRKITRQDCLDWCAQKGFKQPPRSACIGCPFKSQSEWRKLHDTMPVEWADAVDFDHQLRGINKTTKFRGELFLHLSAKPLDQIDLRSDQEMGIFTLWESECEGMCGN